MKFALIVVDLPINEQYDGLNEEAWNNFMTIVASITLGHDSSRISDNVWLCDLESSTNSLAGILVASEKYMKSYRVLYFDQPVTEFSWARSV